ncbi:MAG: hypothetical protein IJR14_09695 [Synergistaceae bacterium]|nr:hypothetical protein [Synergistaceae bacterium]
MAGDDGRIGARVCAALVLTVALCGASTAAPLPERVGEWQLVSEDVTPLTWMASDDLGAWTRLVYERAAPRATLEAHVTEGPGPGALRVPTSPRDDGEAVMEAWGRWEAIDVAGREAILEHDTILPTGLAVRVSDDMTLTLESHAGAEALIEFARAALEALTDR